MLVVDLERVALKVGFHFGQFIDLERIGDLKEDSLFLPPTNTLTYATWLSLRKHLDAFNIASVLQEKVQSGQYFPIFR